MEKVSEKELSALINLLEDDDREIVVHVEDKLNSLGTDIIPFLEKEWMNNSLIPRVREKIEDIIHTLQYDLLSDKLVAWKEAGAEDLLEGMMLVANYQYPDLNLKFLVRKFEQYYHSAWREFSEELSPMEQIKVLNDVFFNKIKFRPNAKNFHSPANGMINVVLESKRGNPLSLCVVYMLLAQRLKMPIYGVNLPNLFILTYKTEQTQFYINVFNNGIIFTTDDINNYIDQLKLTKNDIYYQPCTHVDIVARALRNLISSFEKLGEYKKADDIKILLQSVNEISY